jgi:hypothetical protein
MVQMCGEDAIGDGWCLGVEGDGGQAVKNIADIRFTSSTGG